ncbi:MAG: hydroxyacylglutathione hydrolase [Gammaproteobacteria bacterium]|nr:hydroxyacylglutathione hydrolase [Gammaproteobacteria bacterium]
MPLTLTPVAVLHDNYVWVVDDGHHAVVVDPGEARPVTRMLSSRRLHLAALLITHHHADHIGGVAALKAMSPNCQVIGCAADVGPLLTHPCSDGDQLSLPSMELAIEVLAVPGHTLHHLAYRIGKWLFCGDTLFGAGCGRLLEGSPQQMHDSLLRLVSLPDDTLICCAHEYTLGNLAFAAELEPGNHHIHERLTRDRSARQRNEPTLPSTLRDEKKTNPFLRCHLPELQLAVGARDGNSVTAFTLMRQLKDIFRTA